MQGPQQTDLIKLKYCKQNIQLNEIKKQLSQYPKYFFNQRENIVIIYDKTKIYAIKREETKIYDLGHQYLISDLTYNHQRQILIFLTVEGQLILYFLNKKNHLIIKKDIKKSICFNWVYSVNNIFQFFISDESGVKLYKIQEQKKLFKQVKHLSGKYNSFLYQPLTETLVGFPIGDCKQIHTFIFTQSRYSNWFKSNHVNINFENDQVLTQKAKKQKSLGLDWQKNTKQIFTKNINQDHFVKLFKINKKCQLIFFFTEQGLLRITSISEDKERQISIKLPSDSIPEFNILDDMIVVHLKAQGITFIYDLNGNVLQPLVSPYPLRHIDQKQPLNIYDSAFVGQRVIHPTGIISKWLIQHSVIFSYLKNQLQIFDFFIKRKQAKMELLKWIRREIFKIKQVHLSKFWKSLFLKYLSGVYPQNQVVNLVDLHSNIFYTISSEELIPKQRFLNIILQCIRQALELKMNIPLQIQNLIFKLLIEFKKYDTLIYLSHNDVIKDNDDYIKILLKQYSKNNDMIIGTLAIDMTFRSGSCKDMIKLLMKFNRIREAKKHIKLNYQKVQALYLIEVAKYIISPTILQDYLKWIKSFILIKYPTMNMSYINQAQQKLFSHENKNRISEFSENLIK